ncbi:hypothetical protein BH11PLA2_BH11PLA2_25910 [soil metagenome]
MQLELLPLRLYSWTLFHYSEFWSELDSYRILHSHTIDCGLLWGYKPGRSCHNLHSHMLRYDMPFLNSWCCDNHAQARTPVPQYFIYFCVVTCGTACGVGVRKNFQYANPLTSTRHAATRAINAA